MNLEFQMLISSLHLDSGYSVDCKEQRTRVYPDKVIITVLLFRKKNYYIFLIINLASHTPYGRPSTKVWARVQKQNVINTLKKPIAYPITKATMDIVSEM